MNLQETIKALINEHGTGVLSSPMFYAMLEDYGAFNEEEAATKVIVRELVRSGQVRKIMALPKTGKDLNLEIRSIVTGTASLGGFREEPVSEALKKILVASGKIQNVHDWPISVTPVVVVPVPATKVRKTPPAREPFIKWVKMFLAILLAVTPVICAIFTIINLVQSIYRLFVGPPDVAEAHAWDFLICLICTILSGLVAVIAYEFE